MSNVSSSLDVKVSSAVRARKKHSTVVWNTKNKKFTYFLGRRGTYAIIAKPSVENVGGVLNNMSCALLRHHLLKLDGVGPVDNRPSTD